MTQASEPSSICLLRLSALGDVTHVLPVYHALRQRFPQARISWVIGRLEQKLLDGLSDVEWIVVDRKRPAHEWRRLRTELAGRRFDVLMVMQLALRAGVIASAIPARRRIGYPKHLHKELHGWFVHESIAPPQGKHVIDLLMGFAEHLGASVRDLHWSLPIPEAAHQFRRSHFPDGTRYAVMSPCSSHPLRNWSATRYATVADALAERGLRVVLVGGRSALETDMGEAIVAQCRHAPLNLIGKDTLKQLLAMLKTASVVITPDSGPAHFASALGTPVIALHAATDAQRSGPYRSLDVSVNAFETAARSFLGKPAHALRWGTKIERPGVMDLVGVDAVIDAVDRVLSRSL